MVTLRLVVALTVTVFAGLLVDRSGLAVDAVGVWALATFAGLAALVVLMAADR